MAEDQDSVAESAVVALAVALIRAGAITGEDLAGLAEHLHAQGEHEKAVAHLLLAAVLEAGAPSQSDWEAQRARNRFTVIDGDQDDH